MKTRALAIGLCAAVGLVLVGCSPDEQPSTSTTASNDAATTAAAAQEGSIQVENCGQTFTLDSPAQQATLLAPNSVTTLSALGVLDQVVAKAGFYPPEYFDDATNAKLDGIETLSDRLDPSGHLQISREQVMATNPDLIIGYTDQITPDTMKPQGIPVVTEEAYCDGIEGDATWEDVYHHVELYAALFGKPEEGAAYIEELKKTVASFEGEDSGKTVAVLYPTVGGGVTYAYGTGSMSHPVVTGAGLENVFADTSERVFEVSAEQLVDRAPDVIVALYQSDNPDEIIDAVRQLPGSEAIPAVRDNRIIPLLFNYAEPPTPLAVKGVEVLKNELAEK
ncbi:ABC transporter substrate-binding protein [Corynebacterium uterequi]|uniref:ABC-type Fe3+-hydroxamate transport system, periplasmic component n=1 Tax=Corynebacterium uterequi TaxID=1072256 RepID=A0A0G3H9Y4_9CORY|nr:ABC transporter substrate-binding protein [Corynebacterium uterequi]AKK10156.1 ABC-type Fe3+-hydroxamate transport system, periplasmic component [Corynebacterium uterequi]